MSKKQDPQITSDEILETLSFMEMFMKASVILDEIGSTFDITTREGRLAAQQKLLGNGIDPEIFKEYSKKLKLEQPEPENHPDQLTLFIDEEVPEEADKVNFTQFNAIIALVNWIFSENTLTANNKRDTFQIAISKVNLLQKEIAASPDHWEMIKVSNTDGTLVKASLTDRNGNSLDITPVDKAVQAGVSILINENGGCPITVTPAQIYRAFARMNANEPVGKDILDQVEESLDKLMFSPAKIEFTEQLKNFKRMKKQEDYDYTSKDAGKITENVISGSKLENYMWSGNKHDIAYTIYSYPSFYKYSKIVGNIATVRNELLTGDATKTKGLPSPKTIQGEPSKRKTVQYITLQYFILEKIQIMKGYKKSRKPYSNKLLMEDLMREANVDPSNRSSKQRLKNSVEKYLTELKKQPDGIKDFNECLGAHKAVTAFEIIL